MHERFDMFCHCLSGLCYWVSYSRFPYFVWCLCEQGRHQDRWCVYSKGLHRVDYWSHAFHFGFQPWQWRVWEVQLLKWLKRLADSSILFLAFWKEEQNLICNLCQNLYRCFTKKNEFFIFLSLYKFLFVKKKKEKWSHLELWSCLHHLLLEPSLQWRLLLVHLFPVFRYAAILDPPVRVPFCHNPPTLKNENKIK